MACINDIINDINGQISFKAIPTALAKLSKEQLCQKRSLNVWNDPFHFFFLFW